MERIAIVAGGRRHRDRNRDRYRVLQGNNFDSDCDPDSDADIPGCSFLFSEQQSFMCGGASKRMERIAIVAGGRRHRDRNRDRYRVLQGNNFDSDCDPDSDADIPGCSFLFSEQARSLHWWRI